MMSAPNKTGKVVARLDENKALRLILVINSTVRLSVMGIRPWALVYVTQLIGDIGLFLCYTIILVIIQQNALG